jgi:hypothetical protein
MSFTFWRISTDSAWFLVDSTIISVDSVIMQWGAGLGGITTNADTITTVTYPDTIIISGLIEGGGYHARLLAYDAGSGTETTSVVTFSRLHNVFWENIDNVNYWSDNCQYRRLWEMDNASDDNSTGPLPINTRWMRFHVAIDGEDDVSTGDSIAVYLWNWNHGDSTIIDTLVAQDADTTTITPLKFLMQPYTLTDSSLTYYPEYDWGTHFSVSAEIVDTTIYEDSTVGLRTVGIVIEEIE